MSEADGSWTFIDANLTEANYCELGGPFRRILENFLKRTAAKLECKVKFKFDGKYTSGDFLSAGIQDAIREALIKADPAEDTAIRNDVARVFGQGDLINLLSHDNPGQLDVTFDQAKDFVGGLNDLTARCKTHKIIRCN